MDGIRRCERTNCGNDSRADYIKQRCSCPGLEDEFALLTRIEPDTNMCYRNINNSIMVEPD